MTALKKTNRIAKEHADMQANRITQIAKRVNEYETIVSGGLDSLGTLQLALDTIQAGFMIMKGSFDMDGLPVPERIESSAQVLNTVNSMVKAVYLNEDIVTKMVVNANIDNLKSINNLEEQIQNSRTNN